MDCLFTQADSPSAFFQQQQPSENSTETQANTTDAQARAHKANTTDAKARAHKANTTDTSVHARANRKANTAKLESPNF